MNVKVINDDGCTLEESPMVKNFKELNVQWKKGKDVDRGDESATEGVMTMSYKELHSIWETQIDVSEKDFKGSHLRYALSFTRLPGKSRSERTPDFEIKRLDQLLNVHMFNETSIQDFLAGIKCLMKHVFFPSITKDSCVALQNRMTDIFSRLESICKEENAKVKKKKDFFNLIEDLATVKERNPYQSAFLIFCICKFRRVAQMPHKKLMKHLDKRILDHLLTDIYHVKTDCQSYKDSLRAGITDILLATRNSFDVLAVLVISYPALQVMDVDNNGAGWFSRTDKEYFTDAKSLITRAKNYGNEQENLYLFENLITRSLNVSSALEVYTHILHLATNLSCQDIEFLSNIVVATFKEKRKHWSQYSLTDLLDVGDNVRATEDSIVKTKLLSDIIFFLWNQLLDKLKTSHAIEDNLFSRFLAQVNEWLKVGHDNDHLFIMKVLETVSKTKILCRQFSNFVKYPFILNVVEQLNHERQTDLFFNWLENLVHYPEASYAGHAESQFLKIAFSETMTVAEKVCCRGITFNAVCEAFGKVFRSNKFTLRELLSIPLSFNISQSFKYIYNTSVVCALEGRVVKETETLKLIVDFWEIFDNEPETRL